MTTTFKVGDRVRSVIGYRNGQVGTVTLATGFSCNVLLDARADQGPLNFHDSELELVKPEPAFAVGDRVELAGVTGTVKSVAWVDNTTDIKWDGGPEDDDDTIDALSPLRKQLKKLPPLGDSTQSNACPTRGVLPEPHVEEQVFVTGAWYKHKALRTSRFLLAPAGWYQFAGSDLGFVDGPKALGSFEHELTEVDFPL